jgi:hypothetical protein
MGAEEDLDDQRCTDHGGVENDQQEGGHAGAVVAAVDVEDGQEDQVGGWVATENGDGRSTGIVDGSRPSPASSTPVNRSSALRRCRVRGRICTAVSVALWAVRPWRLRTARDVARVLTQPRAAIIVMSVGAPASTAAGGQGGASRTGPPVRLLHAP